MSPVSQLDWRELGRERCFNRNPRLRLEDADAALQIAQIQLGAAFDALVDIKASPR